MVSGLPTLMFLAKGKRWLNDLLILIDSELDDSVGCLGFETVHLFKFDLAYVLLSGDERGKV